MAREATETALLNQISEKGQNFQSKWNLFTKDSFFLPASAWPRGCDAQQKLLLPGAALHYPISTTRIFLASCWPCLPAPPCVVVRGCLRVRRQSQAGKPPRCAACCRPGMRSAGWRASCLEGRALLVAQGNKNIYLFICLPSHCKNGL